MPLFSTRRQVLAAGLAATLLRGPAAFGQPEGFRVIRAREGGYDGTVPGPVLRIRRGQELKVRLINERAAETAIHWHGVRVPNRMDGTSLTQKPVAPGTSFDYRFTPPDAGTFWYRSPRTGENLHGLLIVDEAQPVDVDRDIALLLDAPRSSLTVNGLATLDIPAATNERLRLRLINAAGRFMTVRFDRHPATVVAIDGQPAEPFLARGSRITLAPGNRADLFIDAVLEPGSVAPIVVEDDSTDAPLARLVYEKAPARAAARGEVKPLPPNPLPQRMDFRGALRAELRLDAAAADLTAKPLFSASRGRTVMLALANRSGVPRVLHIHGHHVRLLDALDDGWKPFWLDTIPCVPQQITRVAFVADNAGKWLLHARAIGSESAGLAWFEVT
jgi:FtsP/CotA-like multicopper oxidase with cupredoxin domain